MDASQASRKQQLHTTLNPIIYISQNTVVVLEDMKDAWMKAVFSHYGNNTQTRGRLSAK